MAYGNVSAASAAALAAIAVRSMPQAMSNIVTRKLQTLRVAKLVKSYVA